MIVLIVPKDSTLFRRVANFLSLSNLSDGTCMFSSISRTKASYCSKLFDIFTSTANIAFSLADLTFSSRFLSFWSAWSAVARVVMWFSVTSCSCVVFSSKSLVAASCMMFRISLISRRKFSISFIQFAFSSTNLSSWSSLSLLQFSILFLSDIAFSSVERNRFFVSLERLSWIALVLQFRCLTVLQMEQITSECSSQ